MDKSYANQSYIHKFFNPSSVQLPCCNLNCVLENNIVFSWPVCFYDVLYGSPADGTTSINLSLEPQSAVIT